MFKIIIAVLLVGIAALVSADDSREFWGDDSDERFGAHRSNANWAVQRPSSSSWRRRDFSDESDERWGGRAWARPSSSHRWNTPSRNTWNTPSRNTWNSASRNTWKSPTRNTWNTGRWNQNSLWNSSGRQNSWSQQNKWGAAPAWNSKQAPSRSKWQGNTNSWNRRWW